MRSFFVFNDCNVLLLILWKNEELLEERMAIIYTRDKWTNNKSLFCSGWDDVKVSKKMVFDLEVNKRKLTRNPIGNTEIGEE